MKRNKFSLSHYKLLSCDMGELIPVGLTEVLPGDSFQMSTSLLVRVSPLLAPVMHPVHVRIHHWFVPHRLIWDDFEAFITGGPDGMDVSAPPSRNFNETNAAVGTLPDYYGVPTPPTGVTFSEVSVLPFRGYQLIFNEWYRDQDLTAAAPIIKTSGGDSTTSIELQRVAWEKDYFTSARPWTQKGPEVSIPLVGDAPVVPNSNSTPMRWQKITGGDFTNPQATWDGTGLSVNNAGGATPGDTYTIGNPSNLKADLSGVSAANINDLRLAFALQRYEEARARYGSRYTEYLRYLGVRSSDARLQRPEYLGGGKQTIQFSEVLQTSPTTDGDDDVGVGNLKGHGIAGVRSNRWRRFFEEHGFIHTLMSVRPRTMYVQGLPRHFNRRVKEDYWQRELEHIGQQEVLNKEIYARHSSPNGVFGYQDRYDEYRRQESMIAGEFRTTTLDFWHMARIFSAEPVLNNSFVRSNPTKRINAVQTNDVLWIMANHSIQARRQLSKTGTSYIF